MSISELRNKTNSLASQCVKCALCLPYCPTYLLTQDENESPRGRIALFQAVSQQKLSLDHKVAQHIDQCLGCRACEAVCPAHVQYGELLVTGRALLHAQNPRVDHHAYWFRWLRKILETPSWQKGVHAILWQLERIGLRQWARKHGIIRWLKLSSLDAILPPVSRPTALKTHYRATGTPRGQVQLFIGCLSSWVDLNTVLASIFVLQKWGYDVWVPPQQTCCGALSLHAGALARAATLTQQNQRAFSASSESYDATITLATGCSTVLTLPHVVDICDFLQAQPWPTTLSLKTLNKRVKLHTPCTRRYVLKNIVSPEFILSKIPGLTVEHFSRVHCCGAAGSYMLEHPQLAESLADELVSEAATTHPDIVVTTNIGCALHLRKEFTQRNLAIEVGHPVMLLACALGFQFS